MVGDRDKRQEIDDMEIDNANNFDVGIENHIDDNDNNYNFPKTEYGGQHVYWVTSWRNNGSWQSRHGGNPKCMSADTSGQVRAAYTRIRTYTRNSVHIHSAHAINTINGDYPVRCVKHGTETITSCCMLSRGKR